MTELQEEVSKQSHDPTIAEKEHEVDETPTKASAVRLDGVAQKENENAVLNTDNGIQERDLVDAKEHAANASLEPKESIASIEEMKEDDISSVEKEFLVELGELDGEMINEGSVNDAKDEGAVPSSELGQDEGSGGIPVEIKVSASDGREEEKDMIKDSVSDEEQKSGAGHPPTGEEMVKPDEEADTIDAFLAEVPETKASVASPVEEPVTLNESSVPLVAAEQEAGKIDETPSSDATGEKETEILIKPTPELHEKDIPEKPMVTTSEIPTMTTEDIDEKTTGTGEVPASEAESGMEAASKVEEAPVVEASGKPGNPTDPEEVVVLPKVSTTDERVDSEKTMEANEPKQKSLLEQLGDSVVSITTEVEAATWGLLFPTGKEAEIVKPQDKSEDGEDTTDLQGSVTREKNLPSTETSTVTSAVTAGTQQETSTLEEPLLEDDVKMSDALIGAQSHLVGDDKPVGVFAAENAVEAQKLETGEPESQLEVEAPTTEQPSLGTAGEEAALSLVAPDTEAEKSHSEEISPSTSTKPLSLRVDQLEKKCGEDTAPSTPGTPLLKRVDQLEQKLGEDNVSLTPATPLLQRVEQIEKKLAYLEDKQTSSPKGSTGPSTPQTGVEKLSKSARFTLEEAILKGTLLDRVSALEHKLPYVLQEDLHSHEIPDPLTVTKEPTETIKASGDCETQVTSTSEDVCDPEETSNQPQEMLPENYPKAPGQASDEPQVRKSENEAKVIFPVEEAAIEPHVTASAENLDDPQVMTPDESKALGEATDEPSALTTAEEVSAPQNIPLKLNFEEKAPNNPVMLSMEEKVEAADADELNSTENPKTSEDPIQPKVPEKSATPIAGENAQEDPVKLTVRSLLSTVEKQETPVAADDSHKEEPIDTRDTPQKSKDKVKGKGGSVVSRLKARLTSCVHGGGMKRTAKETAAV